jgi:hypothetical protein
MLKKRKKNKDNHIKELKQKRNPGKSKVILSGIIAVFLITGLCAFGLSGREKGINTSANNSFAVDEVMRINNQKVIMNEFLLYAADVYQGYNLQKEANWDSMVSDAENNSITFEEQVKGTICEQIRMTKILCLKAKEDGISLSEDEKKILLDNAKTYYTNLTAANVVDKALTVDLIAKFYEENALAQKVYNKIGDSYDTSQTASTQAADTGENDSSGKEQFFIETYHNLADQYDKNYDYKTSINWDLLNQISFSGISKDNDNKADAKSSGKTSTTDTLGKTETTGTTETTGKTETTGTTETTGKTKTTDKTETTGKTKTTDKAETTDKAKTTDKADTTGTTDTKDKAGTTDTK